MIKAANFMTLILGRARASTTEYPAPLLKNATSKSVGLAALPPAMVPTPGAPMLVLGALGLK